MHISMPAMPLALPVTAQVQAANGECWGAVFGTSIVNDASDFKAKSD